MRLVPKCRISAESWAYPNVRFTTGDPSKRAWKWTKLSVVEDYSRELIGQLTEFSISGARFSRFRDRLVETRGKPEGITCDNGTEFTSKAMFYWSKETCVKLNFIQPGKPTQNAFVESLNGKFRDTFLNLHWFRSIEEAWYEMDQWRYHYNHERPHSSLNYLTPVALAEKAA